MRLGELFTLWFLYDKSKKFDEMHEAITAPAREAARVAKLEQESERRFAAEASERRRQQERQRKRQEGASKFKRHCDGKPFRIFGNNAVGTTSMWLQGRKLFAETYDDGRLKGYAVYEGLYLDMRLYSVHEFHERFSRWVENSPTCTPAPPASTSSGGMYSLSPMKAAPSRSTPPLLPPPIRQPSVPPVRSRLCTRCGAAASGSHRFCSQCGSPLN